VKVGEGGFVVFGLGELVELLGVAQLGGEFPEPLDPLGEGRALLEDGLRLFRAVPEPLPGEGGLDLLQAGFGAFDVKDNLGFSRVGPWPRAAPV